MPENCARINSALQAKLQDMNKNTEKPSSRRLGKLDLLLGLLIWLVFILAVLTLAFEIGNLLLPQRPFINVSPNPSGGANSAIVYSSSTHLCLNGCPPHQNWIEFYLPPGGFVDGSAKLKTYLYMGQILTVGISGERCKIQDTNGFLCLDMMLSHTLLSALTGLDLMPLDQLRDVNNWWLEYKQQ